jgi:metal-sulfur cluster biosynthetic enzyme
LVTIAGLLKANVDLVWDPPWNPQMIAGARETLGIN